MLGAARGDLGGFRDPAAVDDRERLPEEPSDASRVVAPGDARAEGEFIGRVVVVSGRSERAAHLGEPALARGGVELHLAVELADEVLGLGESLGRIEPAEAVDERVRGVRHRLPREARSGIGSVGVGRESHGVLLGEFGWRISPSARRRRTA